MIRVLHFADIVNRDDFIHVVLEHCGPEFCLAAATLDRRGTLNSQPGSIPVFDFGARTLVQAPLAAARLRRLLKAWRVDVVHAHHYRPNLITWLATRGSRVRWIIGRHYSDAVYQLSRGMRRRTYLRLEKLCNDASDAIVAPSLAVEAILHRQGVECSKIARIPYAFDFRRFEQVQPSVAARAAWGHKPGLRLATFARLHREKGHWFMLQALRELLDRGTGATWLVVGDGPERAALELQARERALGERVRFAGWRTDVPELMAASDVVVQPTLHEAFSQVMVEAMAMGRPLVISDVSGVADVVRDQETGVVVPAGDSGALVVALQSLVDTGRRDLIGTAAKSAVRGKLSTRLVIPKIEDLYRRVSLGASGVAP